MKEIIRITENDLHRLIENSVNRALNEGVFNYTSDGLEEDSSSDDLMRQEKLAREIYAYLKALVSDVHVGGSQIELYINDSNKFAADKVAQKYRGQVRITHLNSSREYKILAL